MSAVTTYSFADTVGSISNPLGIPTNFIFSGQLGVGAFHIGYTVDRSTIDVAADGAIMISSLPGNNGTFTVEAQQTSTIHAFLFALFNALISAQALGDVSNWAATTVLITSVVDKTQHALTGVCFTKPPDIPYGAQGARITWNLLAAQVVTVTL